MSATALWNLDLLTARSQDFKPGVKKLVKSAISRAQRRGAKRDVAQEATQALTGDLSQLTPDELELYADALLQASHLAEEAPADDSFILELEAIVFDEPAVPSNLLGSLPDWMIAQVEAANGSAFDLLSLFEAKCPSPKAAISMDDEALYA